MALIDLTHPLSEGMPVFPGEPGPTLRNIATIKDNGYRVKWLEMGSHTGTHMDAPAHLLPEGKMLDQYPVSHYTGKAVIIPVPKGTAVAGLPFLASYEQAIRSAAYVLLNSGWSRYWGSNLYFTGFPVLSEEAAHWLTGMGLKGIGLDTISVDPVDSRSLPVHHILLEAGLVIIENLFFPETLHATSGLFHCFPLRIKNADGSPIRAVLSINELPED